MSKDAENSPYPVEEPRSLTPAEIGMSRRIEGAAQAKFGARMAAFRRAAGFTQRELGAELGVSQRMIAYYEVQTDYPPSGILTELARVLGVTTDELLGVETVRSATRKPQDTRLWRRFKQVEKLPAKERRQILQLIDTFLEREKLRAA